jgi:hypothetical protein
MQNSKALCLVALLLNSVHAYANKDHTVIDNYTSYENPILKDWTISNETVNILGGHMGHLQPKTGDKDHHLQHNQEVNKNTKQEKHDGH